MPDQNTQPPTIPMTSDEHAAALGFVTTVAQQLHMAQQPQEGPQPAPSGAQNAPDPRVDDLMGQFQALKEDTAKAIKEEIGMVKDMIKTALDDEKD